MEKTKKQLRDQARRIFYRLFYKDRRVFDFGYNDIFESLPPSREDWVQHGETVDFSYEIDIEKKGVVCIITHWGSIDPDDFSLDGFDFVMYTPCMSVEVDDFTDYIEKCLSELE